MELAFKTNITNLDKDLINKILRMTNFFNEEEIAVALELIDDHLEKGNRSDYNFLVAYPSNDHDALLGYTCFGHIPGTHNCYDLYWIVVSPEYQNKCIGKQLLTKTEQLIKKDNGRKLYAETSGRQQYLPSREFYLRNHFIEEARLQDFYAQGDDKIIYSKNLSF